VPGGPYSRSMKYQRVERPLKLDGLNAAKRFFAGCFAECDQARESLWVAHLDDQARCLHLSHYRGEATGADFPLRAIVIEAIRLDAAGVVLAHNHPSGDARPSQDDLSATRRLASVAETIDCTILDHLVFAGDDCRSFRQMGLL